MHQRVEGAQLLGWGEGAVSGPIHKGLSQQLRPARRSDGVSVRALLLDHAAAIAGRVRGDDGNMQAPIEYDVVDEVLDRGRIGLDAGCLSKCPQVVGKAESSMAIQSVNLIAADRTLELLAVVDARVGGEVAAARRSMSTRWFK